MPTKKPKKPDLWMPWYIGDYLADTAHLSTFEHGAYMLLMAHAWMNNGMLPLDTERCGRIARASAGEWELSRDVLMAFWTEGESGFFQKRLSEELERAKILQKQKAMAGKAGANARWGAGNE